MSSAPFLGLASVLLFIPVQAGAQTYASATPQKFSYGQPPAGQPSAPQVQVLNNQVVFAQPKTVQAPQAQVTPAIPITTLKGSEVGLQLSGYRYQEHVDSQTDFMRETGWKAGASYGYTGKLSDDVFITGEGRFAYGQNHYHGVNDTTKTGLTDVLFEVRGLVGEDFVFNDAFWGAGNIDVSPYTGLGFRYLYNDARGDFGSVLGTEVLGYERHSQYLYLPIGVTPRFRITQNSRLSTNIEYDQLLYGWQISNLNQVNPGFPEMTNNQFRGWGFRGSVMWETSSLSFGPFVDYWNIAKSDIKCQTGSGFIVCADEPSNQTLEAGIQGKYRF